MEHSKPSYYITTPIYYVNAKPHLGTAYCTVLADVQARFQRACGKDVKFLTGMDEHGEKVAEAAEKNGFDSPQAWCDSMEPAFRDLWETLEISNDDFIRTTQPRHIASVQKFLQALLDRGYIYKGSYDGWYCRPEETYFTETQVRHHEEDGVAAGESPADPGASALPGLRSPARAHRGGELVLQALQFQQPLLDFYEAHPHLHSAGNAQERGHLVRKRRPQRPFHQPLHIRLGAPVPLSTTSTLPMCGSTRSSTTFLPLGMCQGDEAADSLAFRWPAQVHVVGKDIIRCFHCVIWPALLMAAGLPLPSACVRSPASYPRNEETGKAEKMSKSRGNAIAPEEVIDLLGVQAYRYYFMSDVVHGTDAPISWGCMRQVYNADLANSWETS